MGRKLIQLRKRLSFWKCFIIKLSDMKRLIKKLLERNVRNEESASDLVPRGIRSTYGERHDFNETFETIYEHLKKI
jgi:hypothetical protein